MVNSDRRIPLNSHRASVGVRVIATVFLAFFTFAYSEVWLSIIRGSDWELWSTLFATLLYLAMGAFCWYVYTAYIIVWEDEDARCIRISSGFFGIARERVLRPEEILEVEVRAYISANPRKNDIYIAELRTVTGARLVLSRDQTSEDAEAVVAKVRKAITRLRRSPEVPAVVQRESA